MTKAQEEQLLEFLRRDVMPLILDQYPPEGLDPLRARYDREYPDLELLPKA